jgi:hypothetical protein
MTRNFDGPTVKGSPWHITVLSADGQTMLQHHTGEDIKEVQAICTIARSEDLTTQIWIRPPWGEVYSWD